MIRQDNLYEFKQTEEYKKIREYILSLKENSNEEYINPLAVCKTLNMELKPVLRTFVILEKESEITEVILYKCECGNEMIGDRDLLDEDCNSCHEPMNLDNVYVLFEFKNKR